MAYSVTVHSIQGQTLDKVCVYLDTPFAENLDYVALSRTRSIEDIVLLDKNVDLERFRSMSFYKGIAQQRQEMKRLGIYKDVVGSDSDSSDESYDKEDSSADEQQEVDQPDDADIELPDSLVDSQLENFQQDWIPDINQQPFLPLESVVCVLEEDRTKYRQKHFH